MVPLSDRVLLERHARGDRDAFAQLMNIYASRVYGYLARAGVRPADRDDLFQDIFVKVHRASMQQLPDGAVRPWLFAIAVNAVRDAHRKTKVRSIVSLDERAGANEPAKSSRADQIAEGDELAAFLDDQIERLPLEQREALLLVSVEGLDLEDAAAALEAPVNTVKTRVRRARLALAEAMARRNRTMEREGT
ncbi:MAG: RNA polymerase sigma factor [Sandaracinaceae bacterium]